MVVRTMKLMPSIQPCMCDSLFFNTVEMISTRNFDFYYQIPITDTTYAGTSGSTSVANVRMVYNSTYTKEFAKFYREKNRSLQTFNTISISYLNIFSEILKNTKSYQLEMLQKEISSLCSADKNALFFFLFHQLLSD